MGLVRLASKGDLGQGKMKGFQVGDKRILAVNRGGVFYALGDSCPHRACSLSEGVLKRDGVHCPCHDSVFDVRTGKVVKGPAKEPAVVYQVRVEDDDVLVDV